MDRIRSPVQKKKEPELEELGGGEEDGGEGVHHEGGEPHVLLQQQQLRHTLQAHSCHLTTRVSDPDSLFTDPDPGFFFFSIRIRIQATKNKFFKGKN